MIYGDIDSQQIDDIYTEKRSITLLSDVIFRRIILIIQSHSNNQLCFISIIPCYQLLSLPHYIYNTLA